MIRLTGLLALAALASTTVAHPGVLSYDYRVPDDRTTAAQEIHIKTAGELAIERVKAIQALWPENYLYYKGNEELFDKTYAPHAIFLSNGKVRGIGIKDYAKKFWSTYKNARIINVDQKFEYKEDGTVHENVKYYFINKGTSWAFVGENYWKEINGEYKIVLKSYKRVDKQL